MDVTPLVRSGSQIIQSYAGGKFRISGKVYEGAVIVFPDETFVWPFAGSFAELTENDFSSLFSKAPEIDVLLLGCGTKMQFLPPGLRSALKQRGLSVDTMDTGAACRTYNVLMAEGRRVAVALLPFV